MNEFSEFLADITTEAVATFGKDDAGAQISLVWNGHTIPCFEADATVKDVLLAGGLIQETDLVLHALKSLFSTPLPRSFEDVVVDGVARKVRNVQTSRGDPELRIAVMGENQRGS